MKNLSKQGNGNAASQLRRVLLVGTALTGVFAAGDAMAQVSNWIGGTAGGANNWNTAANWDIGGIPAAGNVTTNITVNAPTFQPSLNPTCTPGTIHFNTAKTLPATTPTA